MDGLLKAKRELSVAMGRIVRAKILAHDEWYRMFKIKRSHSYYYGLGYDGVWWPITAVRIDDDIDYNRPDELG